MKKEDDILNFIRQKNYTVVNPDLGTGSFGKTILMKDEQLDNMLLVAKKYEPAQNGDKQKFFKNFKDEIKILVTLNHKNIVRIYNWWLYPNEYVGIITMEYIDGRDLRDYFKNYKPKYSPVSLNDIFKQIIDAFCYIEKNNIIHRDIKENNILVTKDGVVKIIDFGLGKFIEKREPPNPDSLSGKISREDVDISPDEVYQGEYTSQTDMFYIAELFFRLLHDTQKEQFFSYLPVLKKMTMHDSNDRYQTFVEVKQAISMMEFSELKIDDNSKGIYQRFLTPVEEAISVFNGNPEFCDSPDLLIESLEEIKRNHLLEDEIQRNDAVIRSVVRTGFRYSRKVIIPVHAIRDFCEWFRGLSFNDQKLILENIAYRLSKIGVEKLPEDDIPF